MPESEEFEPGSNGQVLKNLLGITDPLEMSREETLQLYDAVENFYEGLDAEHTFTVSNLREMHRTWLAGIYPFAGRLRIVNMSKAGFPFASVQFLESNLASFEKEFLGKYTPCRPDSVSKVADAIARVHGEFIMIHPFREGNGRLGRWLAGAMAAQAGYPSIRYGFEVADSNGERATYLQAIKRAVLAEYEDLTRFFFEAISRSL